MNPQLSPAVTRSPDQSSTLRWRDSGRVHRHAPAARTALALLIAVLAPIAALLVELDLMPVLGGRPSALPTVAAIVIAAWFGGPGPGLLATVLALVLEAGGMTAATGQLDGATQADHLTLAMLAGTGLLVDGLAAIRARAERRSTGARRQAEEVMARADIAARRLEALQRLATDLADAETADDMIVAVILRGRAALQADRAVVGTLGEGGDALRIVAAQPDGPDAARAASDADQLALLGVAQTGTPWFDDGAPATGDELGRAVAAVPLQLPSGPGVLAYLWGEPHPLPADRRAFISALARAATAALDRHRMFIAEVAALRRAEAAAGYLNILADAGRTLGTTLDYEDLVRILPRIGIPQLGDLGILDLEEATGPRRVVFAPDETLDAAVAELARHPMQVSRAGRSVAMLELGRAVAHRLDDDIIGQLAETPAHAAALHDLAPAWLLQLPLAVEGPTSGVLTFVRRSDQPFELAEINVGEELGRRAGRALENARLHRQVEEFADQDRRRAAEMEAVLGAVGEGFLLADSGGTVRASNSATAQMFGGTVTSIGGLLDELLDSTGNALAALPDRPTEVRLRNRPNTWVEVTTYRVAPSSELGQATIVVACRDVTAFRSGQALREAFMGLLSHELRTPVTTIYAAAAVLTKPGRTLQPEVAGEILADIAGEADRLYRLVEDLMVLARFDEGIELGSQPVLLQHLVPTVVELETSRWPAASFSCRTEESGLMTVGGDETAIAQVLRNLLSNAAKYSPVGGRIEVVIRAGDDGVEVAVGDEGPGLGPAEAEKVFDPFYRSPSTAGLASGAGIGLYVSRRLVEAMGGRIRAHSPEHGGSEFSFTLPRHRDAATRPDEGA